MSSGVSRVFVARLSGVGVFDPRGDQVGKVRDVVVAMRSSHNPPRALGLVVEVQPRRRIFCPMTRVTNIDAGAVVTTGLLNMRRFEQRPGETLVLGELFDKRVTLLETGQQVTVQDVAIQQDRTRDWLVSRIYVRKPGSGFRRRGETVVVEWDAVDGLSLHDPQQGVESLLATVENLRPADLANVMHELTSKRRIELAAALDDDRLADVLEELPEDDRIEIVVSLGGERAADVLEEMDPDDAADLLAELPPEQAEELLSLVEPEDAEDLRRLLSYAEYTAGGMMTPEPVILPPDSTVAEALARVRDSDLSPSLAAQVYVVRAPFETPTGKYLGVAHFQTAAARTAVDARLGGARRLARADRSRCSAVAGDPLLRDVQPGRAAGRRRERPPARRGDGRRRHRPHAPRQLARGRRRLRGRRRGGDPWRVTSVEARVSTSPWTAGSRCVPP